MDISLLSDWDRHIFFLLNHNWGLPWLDAFMLLMSSEKTWLVSGLVFLVAAWFYKNPRLNQVLWVAAITLGIADLVCFRLIKPALHRLRPCYQMDMVRLLEPSCGSDYGLPSNHAANSMAFVVVILCLTRNWRWSWLFLLPLIVGTSRSYVGVHFPSDVVVGFFVGGGIALLVSSIFILGLFIRARKEKP